jgi:hypothetical protein
MIKPTAAKRYVFTEMMMFVVEQGILSVLELTCQSLLLEVKGFKNTLFSITQYSVKYFLAIYY